MPRKLSPFKEVKERFGSKEKLVDEVVNLLALPRGERDVTRERLRVAANSKLLRLHANATTVKEKFEKVENLVEAILELTGHAKDDDRRDKLMGYDVGRLLDLHRQAEDKKAGKGKKTKRAKKGKKGKKAA